MTRGRPWNGYDRASRGVHAAGPPRYMPGWRLALGRSGGDTAAMPRLATDLGLWLICSGGLLVLVGIGIAVDAPAAASGCDSRPPPSGAPSSVGSCRTV